MELPKTLVELAYAIRATVRPHIGLQTSRLVKGKSVSGDEAFEIDKIAEQAIDDFIRKHELQVAYYSEDRGLVKFGKPEYVLIIDPIDGTRPAMAGFESCVVSIALAPCSEDIRLSDVVFGCILEIKNDRLFTASRKGFASIREGERELPVTLSANEELDKMAWTFELAGRPIELVTDVLSPLIDKSSLRGGVFVFSSTAYSLTRLLTGQLSAVVDVGNRIFRDFPETRNRFVQAGMGTVMGLFPYDIAAAVLIAETAGCTVTDAYGNKLDDTLLLNASESNIRSCIATSNPRLHELILSTIESRMEELSIA